MDLLEFKEQQIKNKLAINDDFGIVHAFIDFANKVDSYPRVGQNESAIIEYSTADTQ